MSETKAGLSNELFRQIRDSSAPGMEAEVIEKILRGYFSGKRDSVRTYKLIEAEIQGKRGTFRALAVDISRSGMLLRIMDPHFASEDEMQELMPYTARVWYHFENGLHVRFKEGEVQAYAEVVRVTGYCGRGNGLILLGCRFRNLLDIAQCEALEIEYGEDRPPGLS